MNSEHSIYVTSEITKQFFAEAQSGGAFLPPEEIVAAGAALTTAVPEISPPDVITECPPDDSVIITVQLNIQVFRHCPKCGVELVNISLIRDHLESCVGGDHVVFSCDEVKSEKKNFTCEHCNKQFKHKKQFTKHRYFCEPSVQLADHAISDQKLGLSQDDNNLDKPVTKKRAASHTCHLCKKTFALASYLASHMRVHTGEKPYPCTHCDKSFADKTSLRNHVRTHTDERPHICHICQKCFRRSDSLKYHLASHEPGNRPFICSQCAKSFKNQRDLKHHEKCVHTAADPASISYVCDVCNFSAESEASLKFHKKVQHGNGAIFECSYCQKKFLSQAHLDIHLRTHTGERPFKCSFCEKSFRRTSHLKQHEQRHTGDTLFNCSRCDRGFPQKSELRNHEKIHTSIKPYKCGVCGKSFAREDYVKTHMRVHESENSNLLPLESDTKVGILPLSAKRDDKHVYVMQPDVPGGSSRHVSANDAVAATIVIPAPGGGEVDLTKMVYLYR